MNNILNITILSDNTAGKICGAEHGLSYYIKYDRNILFDAGASQLFIQNADKTGINLSKTDLVVLSHGHFDHGNGLKHLENKTMVCHPGCFVKRRHPKENKELGINLSQAEAEERFTLILSEKPYKISENILFLGEIPRTNDFEIFNESYFLEDGTPDIVIDDSALSISTVNGLVIVAGCSHSGICNICEYALEITGEERIHAVIGGFHLKDKGFRTEKTIAFFKKFDNIKLMPSHCTTFQAMTKFYEAFGSQPLKTGSTFTF